MIVYNLWISRRPPVDCTSLFCYNMTRAAIATRRVNFRRPVDTIIIFLELTTRIVIVCKNKTKAE